METPARASAHSPGLPAHDLDRAGARGDAAGAQRPTHRAKAFRYSVKYVCGVAAPAGCGCVPIAPGRHATQVSLHNAFGEPVALHLRLVPLVLGGAVAARSPRVALPRDAHALRLPPHAATMVDCCAIGEWLLGAAAPSLSIGLLELTASHELAVAAVYASAGALDVCTVPGIAIADRT